MKLPSEPVWGLRINEHELTDAAHLLTLEPLDYLLPRWIPFQPVYNHLTHMPSKPTPYVFKHPSQAEACLKKAKARAKLALQKSKFSLYENLVSTNLPPEYAHAKGRLTAMSYDYADRIKKTNRKDSLSYMDFFRLIIILSVFGSFLILQLLWFLKLWIFNIWTLPLILILSIAAGIYIWARYVYRARTYIKNGLFESDTYHASVEKLDEYYAKLARDINNLTYDDLLSNYIKQHDISPHKAGVLSAALEKSRPYH